MLAQVLLVPPMTVGRSLVPSILDLLILLMALALLLMLMAVVEQQFLVPSILSFWT